MNTRDRYVRAGGKRRGIVRVRHGQPIDYGIYAASPESRRALNSKVNALHVRLGSCKG